MPLLPRQLEAHDAILTGLGRGITRQLIALPTGTGKTVLACHVSRQFPSTLFFVHREELVAQTLATLRRIDPSIAVGSIRPGHHELAPFTVGMIQTVHQRLDRLDPEAFELVVIDEAHHASARTWRTVADHFRPRLRLGLSATPERADGAPLCNLFDAVIYQWSLAEAVAEGALATPRCIQVLTDADLRDVRVLAGDFNEGDLQRVLNTPARNALVVQSCLKHAPGRRVLGFTAGVGHAQALSAAFQSAGVAADWVSGADPDRAAKIARFKAGELQVLTNAQVLTEGFDDPGIGAVLLARPTQSRPLFVQMIGRGLRRCEGKTDCVFLDFVDTAPRHNLTTAWEFFGRGAGGVARKGQPAPEQARVVEQARARAEAIRGGPVERIVVERLIDLLQEPPVIKPFKYGKADWHYAPVTDPQRTVLQDHGYDLEISDWTRGQASAVIGSLPATPKQERLLLALGYDVLTCCWTRTQAEKAIKKAEKKGVKPDWRRLELSPTRRPDRAGEVRLAA